MKNPLYFSFLFLVTVFPVLSWSQTEVDRSPPEIYETYFKPLLTPLDKVLDGKNAFPDDTTGGVMLLAERLDYIKENGQRFHLYHYIDYGKTTSAASSNEEVTFSYDKEHQRIYLISARSIQEDGTIQDVEDKAAFIQSPQYEAENSLYTSENELKIIFPNVKPGTIVQSIVLKEDYEPILKEEVSGTQTFANYWPSFNKRFSLDLPQSYSSKLKINQHNSTILSPTIEQLPDQRTRYTWERHNVKSAIWEKRAPQSKFKLPSISWSTMDNWDQVARWFYTLVSERDELGQELEVLLDEWTQDLETEEEIIEVLTEKIANDVRYTGLEFGLSGHQPYECSSVWKNQYGDCKDKSNLLRALLKEKGIEAHMALLLTNGHGKIDLENPSHGQFNHVIVALPQADGTYQYIDPTIEYLTPGTLGFGDIGRDIMIVNGNKAVWEKTPDTLAGGIHVSLDLDLDISGELSGWITLEAKNSDASYYTSEYNDAAPIYRKNKLLDFADSFVPGCSILDIDYKEQKGLSNTFKIRGYLLRKSGTGIPDTFSFPFPENWLPSFQAREERDSDFRATRRVESLKARIRLPENYVVTDLPDNFSANASSSKFTANWDFKNRELQASLEYYPTKLILTPDEFQTYRNSVNAIKTWISNAIPLSKSDSPASFQKKTQIALENFPLLSSGDSQIALAEEKYPVGENDELRVLAFDKIIQWFPNEPNTIFEANLHKFRINWNDETAPGVSDGINDLLKKFEGKITEQNKAWAKYLMAGRMWKDNKDPDAPELLIQIAENEDLTSYRRGWSAFEAAKMLQEEDPQKALSLLQEHIAYQSPALSSMDGLYARLLIQEVDYDAFLNFVESLPSTREDELDQSYRSIINKITADWDAVSNDSQVKLKTYFDTFYMENQRFELSKGRWEAFSQRLDGQIAKQAFTIKLQDYLKTNRPNWYTPVKKRKKINNAELVERIIKQNADRDYKELLNTCMTFFLDENSSYADFANYYRWALWWMNNKNFQTDLFYFMAEESLNFSADEKNELYDAWNLIAGHYRDKEDYENAKKYYQATIDRSDAKKYLRVAAAAGIAKLAMITGSDQIPIQALEIIEKDYSSNTKGSDYLLLDAFYRLHHHQQYEDAHRVLSLILNIDQKYIDDSPYSLVVGHVTPLLKKKEKLIEFWKHGNAWWGDWEELCNAHNIDPGKVEDVFVMDDLPNLNSELIALQKQNDVNGYLENLKTYALLAKWVPIFGSDFCLKVSTEFEMTDDAVLERLQQSAILLTQDSPEVNLETKLTLDIRLAVLLIFKEQYQETINLCRSVLERSGKETSNGQTALRLWIISASELESGYEKPSEILFEVLQGEYEAYARDSSIQTLSDLYIKTKNFEASTALLENEKDLENEELLSTLQTRVSLLRNESDKSAELSGKIRKLLNLKYLNWYSKVPPFSLEEGEMDYMTPPLTSVSSAVGTEIKMNFLYALNDEFDIEQREIAFAHAATQTIYLLKTVEDLSDFTLSIVNEVPISIQQKANLFMTSVSRLSLDYKYEDVLKLLNSPYSKNLNQEVLVEYKKFYELANDLLDPSEPKEETIQRLLKTRLDFNTNLFIDQYFRRLVYLGKHSEADSVFKRTKAMPLSAYADKKLATYRLGWMRSIKEAKANYPVEMAIKELILSRMETSQNDRPKAINKLIDIQHLYQISNKEAKTVISYFLETGLFPSSGMMGVCSNITPGYTIQETDSDFGISVLRVIEKLDIPTNIANKWISFAILKTDTDKADIKAELYEEMNQYLENDEVDTDGRTMIETTLRMRETRHLVELRPDAFYSEEAKEFFIPSLLLPTKINYHYTRGNSEELSKLVEEEDYSEIDALNSLAIAYKVLEQDSKADEASLLFDAIKDKIEEYQTASWSEGLTWEFSELLKSSIILDDPSLIPSDLFKRIQDDIKDKGTASMMHLHMAYISKDWGSVKKEALNVLEKSPEFYDANGFLGMALAKLGEPEEAKEHLELGLKYARDLIFYQDAKATYDSL